MREYRVSARGRLDLLEIWDYVAAHNLPAADRLVALLQSKFDAFCDQPELGEVRPELGDSVRVFSVRDYVIAYRSTPELIEILRVFHGARDWNALF